MHNSSLKPVVRFLWAGTALALIAGCSRPLDYDLRGTIGGFSTADAVQQVPVTARPEPDARGVISYPNYQVAVARRGDTVATVASRIGLPADELARFNGIDQGVVLRDGEVLALPRNVGGGNVDIAAIAGPAIDGAAGSGAVQTTELSSPSSTTRTTSPAGPEPVRHKVTRGETAYTVSRLYNVPVKSLAEWNGLGSDLAIREGQFLLIPVAGARPPSAVATTTQPGSGSPTPTPPSATTALPNEKVAPAKAPEVSVGIASKPAAASAAMAFPVSGKIVRAYSKGRNEGIDISGTPGSAVKAAADGSVAAITSDADQVPIVVVRHPNNVLTVYANVDGIKVKKGDKIRRGQPLATLRPGDDSYVHFEVRNGFDSVDPMPYLE